MMHLDLFSGVGGFALAARWMNWETIGFCEIEPYCQRVLAKHWPGVPIYDDVRELTGEQVGPVDIVTAGWPCQDVSYAGKGAGLDGERSGLWSEVRRILSELRPLRVVLENVSALLGRGLGRVAGDLAALGYGCEWHCIPACAIGAPHERDRVWIVAYPDKERCERWSEPGTVAENERNVKPWFDPVIGGLLARRHQWSPEPDVGRVAHGVSTRMDRHRIEGLGNAIVPQLAHIIFLAIQEQMQCQT